MPRLGYRSIPFGFDLYFPGADAVSKLSKKTLKTYNNEIHKENDIYGLAMMLLGGNFVLVPDFINIDPENGTRNKAWTSPIQATCIQPDLFSHVIQSAHISHT